MIKKHSAETLRSIWGSGYHKAQEDLKNGIKVESLIGKWFHSFKDNAICNQGRILSAENDGHFLIQLYSWFDGGKTDQKLVSFSEMLEWNFYNTDQEMRWAYYKTQKNPKNDFETQEAFLKVINKV